MNTSYKKGSIVLWAVIAVLVLIAGISLFSKSGQSPENSLAPVEKDVTTAQNKTVETEKSGSSVSATQCYGTCQNKQVSCIQSGGSPEVCGEAMRSCQNACILGQ